ncbi:uridine kinase [Gilvimarinus sp. 1_MG-2023]|uniref:uridine kinase n=1 Tax=Gilvimarinus sp. 1_MG-2023 TaxID=3062638 RepID=UPI0026E21CE4|nr:uridine kinase [Gilvimarinus sp. 1_MG-2023]MDO6746116.1 uridine kinase [Gilvimarinus sp. 1_MG-2023]
MRSLLFAVAGVSGSGKTSLAHYLKTAFTEQGQYSCCVLAQDSYYRDFSARSLTERAAINFDHPASFDHKTLIQSLQSLKAGQSIEMPQYDYAEHKRASKVCQQVPVDVIIFEGILALHWPQIRSLVDTGVYLKTPLETCFERRLARDVKQRGRVESSVRAQFKNHVEPMFEQYVAPQRQWADIVASDGGSNRWVYDSLLKEM